MLLQSNAAVADTELHSSRDCLSVSKQIEPSDNRIRSLHVINGEHYAGAERVQDLLAMRLPELGVDVAFACLKPDKFPTLRRSRQAPLFELPMGSRVDLRPALALARIIRRDGYDVVHTHSARAAIVARIAARLTGVPIVHHVHGNTASEVGARRLTRINAWAERRLLCGNDAVIAVSDSVADYLRGCGVADDRLFVVPNGVPCRATIRERTWPHGVPSNGASRNSTTLGFVALLRPRKGLEVLLEATALLRNRHRQQPGEPVDVRLRIVGRFDSADYEQAIHQLAHRLNLSDHIDWRGFQSNIDGELDRMDLLAFPSILPEGMPMVLLEAMAAGVPIVASAVAGVTDVLRDGDNACLVEPNDAPALASAIERLLHDPDEVERTRVRAYQQQVDRYSDISMAAGVSDVYRQVLTQRARS